MTDIPNRQHAFQSNHAARPARGDRLADVSFLRRILVGLVAATVLSGAVTVALTTQQELVERFQVASTHGPA